MPSPNIRQPAPTPVSDAVDLPPRVPQLPDDVFTRFPSLRNWQSQQDKWWSRSFTALQNTNRSVSQNVTKNAVNGNNLRVTFNQFAAQITEEVEVIANEQGAQAKRIVTVSAMAGVNSNIKVQTTPPGAPALNDYWIDNSDLLNPITYQWSGTAWVEVTTPISFAGVADERTARVTADGFLSAKYTMTVVAGDVITGFNITSASGPGTNVSNVSWTADQFLIYSGTTKKQMFYADGVQDKVRLANLLTVDGALGAVYVKSTAGAGSFNSAGTTWYVDSSGGLARMSLGTKFVWDGTNLTIDGGITATTGTIGGWIISPTTLSKNNAILDSAGQLVLGTASDVIYLSATDATYRMWAGNVTAGSATFSVTKTGALFSTSGTIGGYAISTNSLVAGSGATTISLSNAAATGLTLGDPAAARVLLRRSILGTPALFLFNAANNQTVDLESDVASSSGYLRISKSTGSDYIEVDGGKVFSTPTIAWNGDALANLYRSTASTLKTDGNFVAAGGVAATLFLAANGSAGAPAFAFQSDTDTGWWWSSSGTMNASTNGVARMTVRDGAVVMLVPLKLDNTRAAGAPVPGGTVTMLDASGATINVITT